MIHRTNGGFLSHLILLEAALLTLLALERIELLVPGLGVTDLEDILIKEKDTFLHSSLISTKTCHFVAQGINSLIYFTVYLQWIGNILETDFMQEFTLIESQLNIYCNFDIDVY